ncbi:hypothetical protein Pst134EB_006047 [Puccinia striiformis f. sp. tritici]|nr:hypothetical protein Pst134EB_006047 [Puccinia striiformis f. sp. tritici]
MVSPNAGNVTRRNVSAGDVEQDNGMDFDLETRDQPEMTRACPPQTQKTDTPPLTLLKKLIADQANQGRDGKVELDASTVKIMVMLLESEAEQKRQLQAIVEEMRHLRQRVQTIEASQLTRAQQAPVPSYASTAAKPKSGPPPPTKSELLSARPGLTIIHAKVGTNPLKGESAAQIVHRTNEVLEKMNAEVRGEKVAVKAVRVLPSGDVSFYSKNRHHKEWLNQNKHEWSKQVHLDLEASPSTYQILAHGVPRNFDPNTAQNKIVLASDNSFLADKIFKMRWAGGARDANDPRKAGSNGSKDSLRSAFDA